MQDTHLVCFFYIRVLLRTIQHAVSLQIITLPRSVTGFAGHVRNKGIFNTGQKIGLANEENKTYQAFQSVLL